MRRAQGGFTLVELLVALTLASLVAMLAYGGLHVALRSWQAAELRQQQMELSTLTQALLRRLLESPQAVSLRDDEGIQQMAFFGESQQLIFVANLPALDDSEQLYWVQLLQEKQLGEEGLSWQLELRYLPFIQPEELNWALLAESLASDGEREVLIEGLSKPWEFGYLERRGDVEDDWQRQWRQRAALPVLLRLSPPRRAAAAELLVAPRDVAYAIFQSR
ncbi:prepilin-type N-terminal cleavage/methylation domain-containing protein [Pseudomonas zhanjiangensis]|uniref:Prepilin-type N-terminal cleavage/methylation domain-containing protein n=1 Tax=Pseudomonas zhanjiangensis TaxID=3239015 RepID=A0ABV3YN74_9PSED